MIISKKKFFTSVSSVISYFAPGIKVFSKKKKFFTSISSLISLFCSKIKKKGLHFDFISDFPLLLPKSRCSLKKKTFSPRIDLVFPTPDFIIISKKVCSKTRLYVLFSRGPEATALFASPNIHHCWQEIFIPVTSPDCCINELY